MDANGTRYHLLLGEDDWTALDPSPAGSAAYDPVREELTLRTRSFRFDQRPGDRAPTLSDRRGAARDRHGNLYWIAPDSVSIRVLSAGSGVPSVFWQPGLSALPDPVRERGGFAPPPEAGPQPPPAQPIALAGLTVTANHYLLAGTTDPDGVLAFDLLSPGPPRHALWPADTFTPFDLCPRPGGGAFVLDHDRGRLWELDEHVSVVQRDPAQAADAPPDFRPLDPAAPPAGLQCVPVRAIGLEDGRPLVGGEPIAIEAAPGGRVLVLFRRDGLAASVVALVDPESGAGPVAELADHDVGAVVVAHDMALVAGDKLGLLYVVDAEGNQSFAFQLSLADDGALLADLAHEYFPMRTFGGKALVAGGSEGPAYDFYDSWVPLARQPRPRHETISVLTAAEPFDAHAPDAVWHRLLLDACIPPQTAVAVETRAAEEREELDGTPWRLEPPLDYVRTTGSELPFVVAPAQEYGTYELLLQHARGRYLQIRLTLSGDGRASPRLRALRAYFPRFSYLERYLPKVYREEEQSAAFMDRFLANFEGIQTGIEDRVAAVQELFDPRSAPAEALDWLLGWFDFAADPTWHDERRRLFLRHATEFFTLRGTIPGIQLALRLALDPCDDEGLFAAETPRRSTSRIVERYRTRQTPSVVLGDPTDDLGPRIVSRSPRWEPAQGGDALTERWREYVGDPAAAFPLQDGGERWQAFVREVLGSEPPGTPDPAVWTAFLISRYRRIDVLDAAYGRTTPSRGFEEVAFPTLLPPDGAALRDWYQFVTIVLPARRAAHRFTVLLPVPPADDRGRTPEERRAIAQRVVELQKPAHTTFDIRFFWAAFRVGEARLAEDTLLGLGSRDPRLHQPVVLGREHAGESFLGGEHAPTADHTGRQPLNR